MAVFKCKMCGASLEVKAGKKIIECEYCNSTQTVPNLNTDNKLKLYDRANHFRQHNDYDKAMSIYEQILGEDREDAEAYWSLVLCRYGIEYVDDPATGNKVPTCHRTIPESIFEDLDYKEAIAHADEESAKIYKKEAKQIDVIQKAILTISQKEEPYDIFICYKEADEKKQRTKDSVIAQDIYDKLTDKGYKVFFARITLEDKLGQEYEPYIYAALTSAKIMLVVGTKPEYFNAVWVKNEWARYLSFMAKDKNKYLIPCYKNMTPYEMPEEFAALQSQDLSKVGFEQDLLRGIDKILGKEKKVEIVRQHVDINYVKVNALIKKSENFLKMQEYKKAQDCARQILELDPNNSQAYKHLLLVEMKESSLEELSKTTKDFSNAENYIEIKAFNDKDLLVEVEKTLESVKNNILNKKNTAILDSSVNVINSSEDLNEIYKAFNAIGALKNWQNAQEVYKEQLEKIYNRAIKIFNDAKTIEKVNKAIEYFKMIGSYKQAAEYIKKARHKATKISNEQVYNEAIKLKKERKYSDAIEKFNLIKSFDDSAAQIVNCLNLINQEEKNKIRIKRKRIYKKLMKITAVVLSIALVALGIFMSIRTVQKNKVLKEKAELEKYISNIISEQTLVENYNKALTDENCLYMGIYPQSKKDSSVGIKYDPNQDIYIGSDGYIYEKINGEYYKNEPIKWRIIILEENVMLLSDLILNNKQYDDLSNNYEDSEIREYINSEFYDKAFTADEKKRIKITSVDNSALTTGYIENTRVCKNTQDKIFLLSYSEVKNSDYGLSVDLDGKSAIQTNGTQYAKANGLHANDNGRSYWWLRSPNANNDTDAHCVGGEGNISSRLVGTASIGVRPALVLNEWAIVCDYDGGTANNQRTYATNGEKVSLTNPTKEGYEFEGWTEEGSSTIVKNMVIQKGSSGHKKFIANWKAKEYTITYDTNGGKISSTTQTVTYDNDVTLAIPTKKGYKFAGWYYGVTEKIENGKWTIASDVTLKAAWIQLKVVNPEYDENENLRYFTYGEYPQTIKQNDVTIKETKDSRGYYLGSDGAYYAKVEASPKNISNTFSNGETITSGKIYYFKVEPIKWKVLRNDNGNCLVVSDLLLDSKCYYSLMESRNEATDYQGNKTTDIVYANNYKYSDIRNFLNTTFLNTAFSAANQNEIQIVTIDNSLSSTGDETNIYSCENTQDKIFLLSFSEAKNEEYYGLKSNVDRRASGTDYAKARGLNVQDNGNSYWWLRSPANNGEHNVRFVYNYGSIEYNNSRDTSFGVRPAFNINL